jgi:sporulation protein YlmC with PRC-barrel domain
MYITDLRHLRIISLVSALRMGLVEDTLLDPACSYVAALRVRTVARGPRCLVLRHAVRHVGRRAVILNGSEMLPDEQVLEHADRMIGLRTLIGLEVVSDEGNLLGWVRNATIDPATLAIESYEVARSPLARALGLRPSRVMAAGEALSASKDVLIVAEAALQDRRAPMRQTVAGVTGMPSAVRWLPPELPEGPDRAGAAMG